MAEEVETGGLMRFRYSGEQAKLSEKGKKDIEDAYKQADERKRKERRKRQALWILAILIIISTLAYFLWK
ncbi:hypothetical protein FJZ18_01540 [Candidatus Pacearchaeota archaeon]|nr:hypothetical protein [Candidatus Pacearchaeota archaeon]